MYISDWEIQWVTERERQREGGMQQKRQKKNSRTLFFKEQIQYSNSIDMVKKNKLYIAKIISIYPSASSFLTQFTECREVHDCQIWWHSMWLDSFNSITIEPHATHLPTHTHSVFAHPNSHKHLSPPCRGSFRILPPPSLTKQLYMTNHSISFINTKREIEIVAPMIPQTH